MAPRHPSDLPDQFPNSAKPDLTQYPFGLLSVAQAGRRKAVDMNHMKFYSSKRKINLIKRSFI